MLLHDPHIIPEPILVVSGLTYLVPFYSALQSGRKGDAYSYLFLTFTTVGFHSTRNEVFFALDCIAIMNFLLRSSYTSMLPGVSRQTQSIYLLSVVYSLVSYFVGKYYTILSFNPDWNTQMMYHSCMHLTTAYSSYLLQSELLVNTELLRNTH